MAQNFLRAPIFRVYKGPPFRTVRFPVPSDSLAPLLTLRILTLPIL